MKSGVESDDIKEKEIQQIVHQINPHFIFNTLAAIRIVTKTDADMAYDMIYDFSKYLRAVFQSLTSRENILFREEAAHILSYANLEKLRFGNNIAIHMDIEEDEFMLPPLLIQPLVENAIIHGLKKGKRKGSVWIRSRRAHSEYIVQVEDDGTGFDVEEYSRLPENNRLEAGGLQRVRYRLETRMDGSIDVKSIVGGGTVVTLHIPLTRKNK